MIRGLFLKIWRSFGYIWHRRFALKFAVRKRNKQGMLKTRPGFTFLEILLVLAIIGILAMLALLNFGPIRRSAQLDLTVDTVDNLINEVRDNARLGKGNVDGQAACWGIKFKAGDFTVSDKVVTFKAPYFRNRTFDKCALDKAETTERNVTAEVPIGIKEIEVAEGRSAQEVAIVFLPPRGEVEVRDGIGTGASVVPGLNKLQLKFGFAEDISDEGRTLIFQPITGEVTTK